MTALDAGPAAGSAFSDTVVLTWRNLKRIPRIPELAAFAILQSVMFVLLFAFVFGGAIPLPGGGSHREYLMPGSFAPTLAFASATTTVGITDDMQKGLVDRFRSLPMVRSAFLTGRVHLGLSARVRVERVRAAAGAARLAAAGGRVESGEHADRGHAGAVRQPSPAGGTRFPSEHPVLTTVLWSVAIVAVFAPLAVRRYRDISK